MIAFCDFISKENALQPGDILLNNHRRFGPYVADYLLSINMGGAIFTEIRLWCEQCTLFVCYLIK